MTYSVVAEKLTVPTQQAPWEEFTVTYVADNATATATDTDDMGGLVFKKGWRYLGLGDSYHGGTSSTTISVGVSGTAGLLINAAACGSAGAIPPTGPTITSGVVTAGPGYLFTANTAALMTIGGADISAKDIRLNLRFRREY